MVIPNPNDGLRAAESLLISVADLMVDVVGQLNDSGVSDLAVKAQEIGAEVSALQTAVRSRLPDDG